MSMNERCEACSIEAQNGTEVDPRLHACAIDPRSEPKPRPAVRRFAEAMERELRANDHKGTWDRCTLGYLAKRLQEEVEELIAAAILGHVNASADEDGPAIVGRDGFCRGPWTEADAARVLSEAADVGNFAMMIADVCARRARS